MSSNIQIGSPFIKKVFIGDAQNGRRSNNPLTGVGYNTVIPAPYRRVLLTIQNNTGADISVYLDKEGDLATTAKGLKLYDKQSLTLDNYNGYISFSASASSNNIILIEAFA